MHMCTYNYNCINSTESDNDLDASKSNGSDRSICTTIGNDVTSSPPTSISVHSPIQQISPILITKTQTAVITKLQVAIAIAL